MTGADGFSGDESPTRGGGNDVDSEFDVTGATAPFDVTDATAEYDDETVLGRIDRYVLKSKLGEGGYGAVYRALDEEAGVHVALKTMPSLIAHIPDEFEDVRQNFALVSKLVHSNIANLRYLHRVQKADAKAEAALGISVGDYLVVMEYVPGSTLSSWRRAFPKRKVPVELAIDICRQIATALDFAHSQKVMHRDIKPSNVMVEMHTVPPSSGAVEGAPEGAAENSVKVLDFGIAAEIRSSMTMVSADLSQGGIIGTRPYMAPEQWSMQRQGAATDQYALAVLFHELVSGVVPFASAFKTGDVGLMAHVAISQKPERLEELSKQQNAVLQRALLKEPEERFGSCVEFIGALSFGQVNKPPNTRKKTAKKRKWLLTALVLCLLGAGIFFGLKAGVLHKEVPAVQTEEVVSEDTKLKQEIAALFSTAQLQFDSGKYSEASHSTAEVLKLDPQHVQALALTKEIRLKVGMEQAVPLKTKAEMELGKVRHYKDGWPGHAPALERLEAELRNGTIYLEQAAYSIAAESFNKVLNGVTELRGLESERRDAMTQRDNAEELQKSAVTVKSASIVKEDYEKAVGTDRQAAQLFEGGKFGEAATVWKAAAQEFRTVEAFASGTAKVARAQAAYELQLSNLVQGMTLLDRYGAGKWSKVKQAEEIAKLLANNEKWNEAVEKYETAVAGLAEAVVEAETVRTAEQVDAYLKVARRGLSSEEWNSALESAEKALALDGANAEAKRIRDAAAKGLIPWLTVVTIPEVVETVVRDAAGGSVLKAGADSRWKLEKKQRYVITVSGENFKTHQETLLADWNGLKEKRIVLGKQVSSDEEAEQDAKDEAAVLKAKTGLQEIQNEVDAFIASGKKFDQRAKDWVDTAIGKAMADIEENLELKQIIESIQKQVKLNEWSESSGSRSRVPVP